eukprot:13313521-Alexandrium_andersonii.AAC.1
MALKPCEPPSGRYALRGSGRGPMLQGASRRGPERLEAAIVGAHSDAKGLLPARNRARVVPGLVWAGTEGPPHRDCSV